MALVVVVIPSFVDIIILVAITGSVERYSSLVTLVLAIVVDGTLADTKEKKIIIENVSKIGTSLTWLNLLVGDLI